MNATVIDAKADPLPPRLRTLPEASLQPAEYLEVRWMATIPAGVPFERCLEHGYWSMVTRQVKPWSIIIARGDRGNFWAELLVLRVDAMGADVHPLRHMDLPDINRDRPSLPTAYAIKWGGITDGFCVIRRKDGQVLHKGMAHQEQAVLWAAEHAKAFTNAPPKVGA